MINAAIFLKALRDSAATAILASLGIIGFVILLVLMMLNIGDELLQFVSRIDFVRQIFEASLGINTDGEVSVNILFAVGFTHAMVLMLAWGTIIATTTRVIVGEIDSGTADLLLTLPVSRPGVYLSTTLAWLAVAAVVSICPLTGVWIGRWLFPAEEVVDLSRYIAPTVNFFAVNVAIGSLSLLFSTIFNRRSIAVGSVIAVAFVSVVLNFVEPFIDWIRHFRFVSLLNFYRPVDIVRTGQWPIGSILVLVVFALACWLLGLLIFSRKDIPAV